MACISYKIRDGARASPGVGSVGLRDRRAALEVGLDTVHQALEAELAAICVGIVVLGLSGLIVGWRIRSDLPHALAGFALLPLFAFALLWVGTLLGLIVRSPDAARGVVFITIFPLTFLANTFVPLAGLPTVLREFASYNPISAVAAACRTLFGNPVATPANPSWPLQHPVLSAFGWCLVIIAIAAPLRALDGAQGGRRTVAEIAYSARYAGSMPEPPAARRRRPTIYDVARLAGVSTATVSRALNGTAPIAAATRVAIDHAVEQLGYRPNPVARSLVTKSTQTIAFLLPDITNPFYAELVRGIQQLTLERDQSMLLCTTDGDPEQEARYLRLLRAKHVDGALVDGLALSAERIAAIVEDGFPIVCLDRDLDAPSIPLVQVDNRAGARMATDYLLSLGHTRIAHVTGAPAPISDERLRGYRGALEAAGIEPDPALVAAGDFTEGGGHAAMRALLESGERFSAVFCANDLSAMGALNAVLSSGRKVPLDLSIVGFDDVRLSPYTSPPLTTIHQPAAEIARRATELLLDLIAGMRPAVMHQLFSPSLVVRGSAGPPRMRS